MGIATQTQHGLTFDGDQMYIQHGWPDNPKSLLLLKDSGALSFGVPGQGQQTGGSWLRFEGNTDSTGEGSGRIFFSEHNSSTVHTDHYGVSFAYRGGAASVTTAAGNNWTGLSNISNGEWALFGHDNNAIGGLLMRGGRSGDYISFLNNAFQITPTTGSIDITTSKNIFDFNKQLYVNGAVVWNSGNDGSGTGSDSDLLDGRHGSQYVKSNESSAVLTKGTKKRLFRVNGQSLAAVVRVHLFGTTDNVVVNTIADIIVNHSQSIKIDASSGRYTPVTIEVISNGNDDFDVYAMYDGSASLGTSLTLKYVVQTTHSDTVVTLNPTGAVYSTYTKSVTTPTDSRVVTGRMGIGTDSFTPSNSDNTSLIADLSDTVLFVGGSIQANGANGGFVCGSASTQTHLRDEELKFGWGGGWYMTDGTYLRVANNKHVYSTGDATFNHLNLNAGDSLSFEDKKHFISANDGQGNFNIRVGHYSDPSVQEKVTEAGWCFHDEWSQSSGWRQFSITNETKSVDNIITNSWRTQMEYDANAVKLRYQGVDKFETTSYGHREKGEEIRLGQGVWNSTTGFARTVYNNYGNFWVGAGNGTWFTGEANKKTQASGLAADATYAHDLLLTTMFSDASHDRGITFGSSDNSAGATGSTNTDSGWRLGKWHSGAGADSSMLVVDGGLNVKGGNTDEFDYYANDFSTYRDNKAGGSYWTGDAGWVDPAITASTAIQIQSGNSGTNTRNPALQFHQYGYGGVQMRYDGPNDRLHFEDTSTDGSRLKHVVFSSDNRSINSANAMVLTVTHQRTDNNGSGIDLVSGQNSGTSAALSPFIRFYDTTSTTDDMLDNTVGDANWTLGVDDSSISSFKIQYGGGANSEKPQAITEGSSRLYIDGPTGLMGVGTTDPKEKLHVDGKSVTTQSGGWTMHDNGDGYVLFEHDAITVHHGNTANYYALVQDDFWAQDVYVRTQFKTTNDGYVGVVLRAGPTNPQDNCLAVVLRSDNNNVRIHQRLNGTQTYPDSNGVDGVASGIDVDDGVWHELEVWLIDDEIRVNVDGVTRLTSKGIGGNFMSAADDGMVGLTSYLANASTAFKNFHRQQLTSGWFLPNSTEVRNNLLVTCKDTETASVQIVGSGSQGTGILKVGQSADYAGGIMYNGDDNPVAIGDSDDVMLFRTNAGSNVSVMRWRYNDSDVDFAGRVGIGLRPGHELDIRAARANNGSVRLRGTTGKDNHIKYDYPDDSTKYWLAGADSSGDLNSDFLIYNSERNAVDMLIEHNTGNLKVASTVDAVSFTTSSDRNLKTDIKPIEQALDKVLTLGGYTFIYKNSGKESTGVVAQEVEQVLPQVVVGEEGEKSVSYGNMVGLLIEAIKEQQQLIEAQNTRIESLEQQIK